MVGTKFYVFGGQVVGEVLNDLWAFDLNKCEWHTVVIDIILFADLAECLMQ